MALNQVLTNLRSTRGLSGALTGADGGTLISAFTRKREEQFLLKTAGIGVIGTLAWRAYGTFRRLEQQRGNTTLPTISRDRFEAPLSATPERPALGLVLQTLIAASHADRHITESERTQLWKRAMDLGATGAELAALNQAMSSPAAIGDLATASVQIETQLSVYITACLVLDQRQVHGRSYLTDLASEMRLPPALVYAVAEELEDEPVAA